MRVSQSLSCWFGLAAAAFAVGLPVQPFLPDVGSSNVLDVLNASPDHRILVRLLQRARLIPAINSLQHSGVNLTFVAPIDTAWPREVQRVFAGEQANDVQSEYDHLAVLGQWLAGFDVPHTSDNINTKLNERLRYHIIDRNLVSDLVDSHLTERQLETTLFLPRHKGPGGGGDGGAGAGEPLLNKNQRVFVDPGTNVTFGWSYGRTNQEGSVVSHMAHAKYATSCSRGLVVAVDSVLDTPPSVAQLIRTHPQMTSLSHLVDLGMGNLPLPVPLSSRALTAFFPADEAFPSPPNSSTAQNSSLIKLTPDEAAWLSHPNETLAAHDRAKFLAWHLLAGERTLYRPCHADKQKVAMALGGSYTLSPGSNDNDPSHLGVAPVVEETILVENGVVHLLGAPLSPYLPAPARSIVPMNVHRTLVARGAGQFATALHQNGLSWAIAQPAWPMFEDPDNPEDDWPARPHPARHANTLGRRPDDSEVPARLTILAVLDSSALDQGSSKARSQLQYHVLPQGWEREKLTRTLGEISEVEDDQQVRHLLPTELQPIGLGGRKQLLDVRVRESIPATFHSTTNVTSITFRGRSVHNLEPILVGTRKDVIWSLDEALTPPQDVVSVLHHLDDTGPDPHPSPVRTFTSWLARTNSTETLLTQSQNITGLIPADEALSTTTLGTLLYNALLHVPGKLDQLIRSVFVHEVVYSPNFPHPPSSRKPGGQLPLVEDAPAPALSLPTLEGGNNLTLATRPSDRGELVRFVHNPERGDELIATLNNRQHDLLTDSGALHVVDTLLFPSNLTISLSELLLSSGLVEMHELIATTRFAHILGLSYNYTLPSHLSKHHGEPLLLPPPLLPLDARAPQPYVVLAPLSKAFTEDLMGQLRNDSEARESFVSRHLLKLPGATDDCSPTPQEEVADSSSSLDGNSSTVTNKKHSGKVWPPASPGPGPKRNPLVTLHPINLDDGTIWGTCANHQLNQVSVRVSYPDSDDEEHQVVHSNRIHPAYYHPNRTVTIGIHGAYGPTQNAATTHVLDRGIQVVHANHMRMSSLHSTQSTGGVLLLDTPIAYDPRWDSPPRVWAVWLFGLAALLAALVPVKALVFRYWPVGSPSSEATQPLLEEEAVQEDD